MTKRQLEKVRKRFEETDLSRYRILTYDEMLKVNGGSGHDADDDEDAELSDDGDAPDAGEAGFGNASETPSDDEPGESGKVADAEDYATGGNEVENSHEAVANAEPGDTITRDDGTEVTLTEADIEYEQNYCDAHGIDWQGEEKSPDVSDTPEAPVENLPELDDDSGSDCDSSRSGEVDDRSEASRIEESGSHSGGDKSSCAAAEKSEERENEQNGTKASGKSETDKESDGSKNASPNGGAETLGNASEAESSKATSRTPQETSRSADDVQLTASHHSEKSEHGFWDSVMGKVSDAFSAAKDWVCDVFGIGDGKKDSENIAVEQPLSPAEKVKDAIAGVGEKKYEKGKYQCDEYVSDVVKKAGYNPVDYYVDNPSGKTVAEHINDLKNSGSNYSMQVPTAEGVYVVFMDGKGSLGTLDPHCGILEVSANGEMSFIHNSSANSNMGVDTWNVSAQNDGTKLSGLAYSDFYFQEIK